MVDYFVDDSPYQIWEINKQYEEECSSDDGYACYRLAVIKNKDSQYTKALQLIENIEKIGTHSEQNLMAREIATNKNWQREAQEQAVELALSAVEQMPENFGYYDTLAATFARIGKFEAAISTQKIAIKFYLKYAPINNNFDKPKAETFKKRLEHYQTLNFQK